MTSSNIKLLDSDNKISEHVSAEPVQLKPYDYKVGCIDNDGELVVKIYAKLKGYVIYRTKNAIRIDINDEHPKCDEYTDNHFKIGVELARIYSWLPENLSWSEPINRQIARALSTNAKGYYEDAKKMLLHAEERIIKLKTIKGRLQYAAGAFILALIVFFIAMYQSLESYSIFYYIVFFGSLGGVLSIAIGFSTLEIDIDANQTTNYLIGVSRILIAMTAAVFSYFAIKSQVAFSFVGNVQGDYGVYMIAMVSGFVEMLIPNIMSNVAKENSSSKKTRPSEVLK
ncbi:hypothetical protein [Pseudomonas sp. R45(2017)]|uniref:hypothetical protein n=1 Tax=Pseudomonas sp. R45(2017) TaxID=1981678 RepID=UPI00111C1EB2|nr:hypothetical protein [Pseudomonas sp. R45(2017)]